MKKISQHCIFSFISPVALLTAANLLMPLVFIQPALAQSGRDDTSQVHFQVEIRDLSPKFLEFYRAAVKSTGGEAERWALFEKMDNFLAVPPTARGREEGRKLLDQAWLRYPPVLDRIERGSSTLSPSPQQALNAVSNLLSGPEPPSGPSEKIVVVTFVGTFDRNAFAAKTSDGEPMIALPIEVPGSELTMTHEFTHVVNQSLGHLWQAGEQTIATLMFTEGLAMRVTQQLDPSAPEYAYVSLVPDWFVECQSRHVEVLSGLIPHLLETGEGSITRFTYGTGASGLTREAYCGGWYAVGYLLKHGWTFPTLARLNRSQINAVMQQTVPEMLNQPDHNVPSNSPLVPHVQVRTSDVTQPGFKGRLYEPDEQRTHNVSVVLIGGSEGHLFTADDIGPRLASLGYPVLGVDYTNGYSDTRRLADVPIEMFTKAANWLKAKEGGNDTRIVMIGYSRGSEAVLLAASSDPDLNGVAVFSPSSVSWSALGSTDPRGQSGWTQNGRPVPFLAPTDQTGPSAFFSALTDSVQQRLSRIPVEHIRAPLLLVASDDDGIWPSGEMARQIQTRLKAVGFRYDVTLLLFNHGSHRILGVGPSPPTETYKSPDRTRVINFGGTADGNENARDGGWAALLDFLNGINNHQ